MASRKLFDIKSHKADTAVILVSGYSNEHYLRDVLFGVHCFTQYGIPPSNIHCFLSAPHIGKINNGLNNHSIEHLNQIAPTMTAKYVLASVTGHGELKGIQYQNGNNPESVAGYINPHQFISSILSIKSIEFAALTLGGCFAGSFNYIDANPGNVSLCLLGATGLHNSLNTDVQGVGFVNAFLCYFHSWFLQRVDIDGDGQTCLMDCFKYAGGKTNGHILKNRSAWYRRLKNLENDLRNPYLEPLVRDGIVESINELLDVLYTSQEPWCLNSNQFRNVLL